MNYRHLSKSALLLQKTCSKLPAEYKVLTNAPAYPVELSQKLQDLIEKTRFQLTKNEINNGF